VSEACVFSDKSNGRSKRLWIF